MTQSEFEAFLSDRDKWIDGDIVWKPDVDHSQCLEFRVPLCSVTSYPIVVVGSINQAAGVLSFNLLHRQLGRIYGLDLGKLHRNPDQEIVGETHKHRWRETCMSCEFAYEPPDITATVDNPFQVWRQFCQEAMIYHGERMLDLQGLLFQ